MEHYVKVSFISIFSLFILGFRHDSIECVDFTHIKQVMASQIRSGSVYQHPYVRPVRTGVGTHYPYLLAVKTARTYGYVRAQKNTPVRTGSVYRPLDGVDIVVALNE